MEYKIAIAGNPNCGKTTLFNALTGSNQYVGNWPGVTVEKKEGKLKDHDDVIITDLPGIYSLSPYTMEEVVARNYLVQEKPNAILNIVDGTNLERNLYLTTQLLDLGIPVIVAINMMDIVRKNGDSINIDLLSKGLKCKIIEISALKGDGIQEAAQLAVNEAKNNSFHHIHIFSGTVEHALAHIEEATVHHMPEDTQRWYAVKLFERDIHVRNELALSENILKHIEDDIADVESHYDDDAESIIANERYVYITNLCNRCYKKKHSGKLTTSDKIDRIVTNKILALPIFALIMLLVYVISIGTIGNWTVDFMNNTLFGQWIIPNTVTLLDKWNCAPWLISLVADGILNGVGSVLSFVPQMFILFFLLSILEDCGYMSRVAFIMDKLFRKFGLSGKSFISMLVATGCGVPGIMSSRTIDQENDRRMTVMTTGFIPCGAKMPLVGLVSGALFGGNALVATSAYFMGIGAVMLTGLILKKTKPFAGAPAPFVMELPQYHMPVATNIFRATWERGWSFVKRAGTVVLAASVLIWILNKLSFEGGLHYIAEGSDDASILRIIGAPIAVIFTPIGFGKWEAAVATILGLMAKEEIVGLFGSLGLGDAEQSIKIVLDNNTLAGFSFMMFNLLCAPCFAAMGAIRREMNNWKWTAFTITYMCVFAYAMCLIVYQFGSWFIGNGNIIGTVFAFIVLAFILYMLFRKNKYKD